LPAKTGVVGVVVVVLMGLLSAGEDGSLGVKPTKWTLEEDLAGSR